ncbi:MAG: triphosphoribosyl-dephospho-CoA synthase [Candidatus Bathyarchaeota archaeon]|nr:triphosphoribosyl-dephospho-CoA synthase [Candidatus Bathyarchaeota archaeon]
MAIKLTETVEKIAACIQLATLLEVSAYPKPGNVHRMADFPETKYEHFLASTVALASPFKYGAKRGVEVTTGKIKSDEIEIGKVIKDAVVNVSEWQHGGNTLLGAIFLLSPISVAAGMTFVEESFSVAKLREKLKVVVECSTPTDAVDVYDAILVAKPEGLGKVPRLDVTDPAARQMILDEKITLLDVFEMSSGYDSVAYEWVNNYLITFDLGYPHLAKQLNEGRDINTATVQTFLKILSEVPDTFIVRKVGISKAKEVSLKAGEALEKGGLLTSEGRSYIQKFDREIRDPAHKLSPGTTADIVTAVLAVSILNGYRP